MREKETSRKTKHVRGTTHPGTCNGFLLFHLEFVYMYINFFFLNFGFCVDLVTRMNRADGHRMTKYKTTVPNICFREFTQLNGKQTSTHIYFSYSMRYKYIYIRCSINIPVAVFLSLSRWNVCISYFYGFTKPKFFEKLKCEHKTCVYSRYRKKNKSMWAVSGLFVRWYVCVYARASESSFCVLQIWFRSDFFSDKFFIYHLLLLINVQTVYLYWI